MQEIEKLREIESFTEEMIETEMLFDKEMGQAFSNYEKVFQDIYQALEDGQKYTHLAGNSETTLETLKQQKILTSWKNNLYRIEKDTVEQLKQFEERFKEYANQEYDKTELIARYKKAVEKQGEIISTSDAGKNKHLPEAKKYINKFGKFANAVWHAGYQTHEKIGTELILEQLKDEIHRQNHNKPIDEYDIPTKEELKNSKTAPNPEAIRNNENIESYQNALQMIGFQKLTKNNQNELEEDKWRENSTYGEIQQKVNKLLENNSTLGTHFLNSQNIPDLQNIREIAEDTKRNSIKPKTTQEGKFYKSLEKLGILKSWGESTYIIEAEPEEIQQIENQITKRINTEEVTTRKADITRMLERAAPYSLKAPTMTQISKNPETPHGDTYFYHLGSYNNAVKRAGLEPNKEFRPDTELEAALIQTYHLLERRPEPAELKEITGIKPSIFENRHEEGLKGMMDDLGIPTLDQEWDQAFERLVDTTKNDKQSLQPNPHN